LEIDLIVHNGLVSLSYFSAIITGYKITLKTSIPGSINDSETKQQYNINVFEAKELKKERLKTGDEN
jgi:hypothetical protein